MFNVTFFNSVTNVKVPKSIYQALTIVANWQIKMFMEVAVNRWWKICSLSIMAKGQNYRKNNPGRTAGMMICSSSYNGSEGNL